MTLTRSEGENNGIRMFKMEVGRRRGERAWLGKEPVIYLRLCIETFLYITRHNIENLSGSSFLFVFFYTCVFGEDLLT